MMKDMGNLSIDTKSQFFISANNIISYIIVSLYIHIYLHIFIQFGLLDFQLALKMLQQSKALTDPLSLDNSCLVNQEETANTWPLICDPQHVAQSLVTALNQVTIVKFKVN